MRAERYWLDERNERYWDETHSQNVNRYGYFVLDRTRQLGVARVDDPVDGERLVRLLNEDEKRQKT